ncbi:MAG: aspartate ammonia-lyase [Candidatus Micrarchaeaceae archaeon]
MKYRLEKDALGSIEVPSDAYYGSETYRTIQHFKISGQKIDIDLVYSYAKVKKAAAITNMRAGKLDKEKGTAIIKACEKIINGKFNEQFIIDPFQAGAGTSLNMNVNEVISNIAIEELNGKKGNYKLIHPNDHVNMSQSTNDTYPTTVNITCYYLLQKLLIPAMEKLEYSFNKKAIEFSRIVKIGRTHLQDAVPMKLGEEFEAYSGAVKKSIDSIKKSSNFLLEVPIGGTAVGTGLNTGKEYQKYILEELKKVTGLNLRRNKSLFTDMSFRHDQLELSNSLLTTAVMLTKISNDLRLLSSGPRTGLAEITLPSILPGSSIMPGKINPSIVEMLNMVCYKIIGSSSTVATAVSGAQLELNVFTPVISYELIFSIKILSNAINTFNEQCVKGIKANTKNIDNYLKMDLEVVTALNQYIGYSKAAEIANIALKENKSIIQVCLEKKILDKQLLEKILNPKNEV